ncbi:Dna polymerase epsilon subunit b [Thalictrum thalictroides]|uniref:DNA polymerase II subunit 2 n=1 Tax=Thalictrum thalictroides TaxID=46969 RepID=A0A7J6W669_THATH|nr:Dna polymerase epsilon subunit b [Thalictrum thalictroides]
MGVDTKKKIGKKFKLRGYKLKVEALDEILNFVNRFGDTEDEAIDLLIDEIAKESLKSSIIDKDSVQKVVNLLLEALDAVESTSSSSSKSPFSITDSFVIPKFRYDSIKKVFYEYTGKLPIHGDAAAKAALYRDRYELLLQRISRHPDFSKPAFDSDMTYSTNKSCEISPIQSLVGQTGMRSIMGVISQLEDGFYAENTIIVAEGEYLPSGIFQVSSCGFPPLEDRDESLALLVGLDFFGGGFLSSDEMLRLQGLEKNAVEEMFIILSDIWLDQDETMKKLADVLDGYEKVEVVPSLFVLMGNFCSRPCNLAFNSFSSLRSQFGKLGEMIVAHPRLNDHSRFLFIPGPDDAGPSTALPRCALPKYLTEELQKHVPGAIFSSNPCRIKFYTQEIVFFRQDLLYKMRRLSLIPPSTEKTNDPFQHLVATITHQSHLCPLPLTVQPIIWNYDHCLRLYPTPHTIVLGDRSEQNAFTYQGTTCFNTGSFANDSTFVAYRPCTREVELSTLKNRVDLSYISRVKNIAVVSAPLENEWVKQVKEYDQSKMGVKGLLDSDRGLLTLLLQNEVSGLQVKYDDEWVEVKPSEETTDVCVGRKLYIRERILIIPTNHRCLLQVGLMWRMSPYCSLTSWWESSGGVHSKVWISDHKHFYIGSADNDRKSLTQQFIISDHQQNNSSYLSFAPPEFLFGTFQTDEQAWVDTIKSVGWGETARISAFDWLGQSQSMKQPVYWSSISSAISEVVFSKHAKVQRIKSTAPISTLSRCFNLPCIITALGK